MRKPLPFALIPNSKCISTIKTLMIINCFHNSQSIAWTIQNYTFQCFIRICFAHSKVSRIVVVNICICHVTHFFTKDFNTNIKTFIISFRVQFLVEPWPERTDGYYSTRNVDTHPFFSQLNSSNRKHYGHHCVKFSSCRWINTQVLCEINFNQFSIYKYSSTSFCVVIYSHSCFNFRFISFKKCLTFKQRDKFQTLRIT